MKQEKPDTQLPELPAHLLLYDGVCGLCNRLVQWILAHERDHSLHFAPLQGDTAERLRQEHPIIPREVSSVVYLVDGRIYLRSKAILHSARHLRWPWRVAFYLRWFPAFLADLVYRLVARLRYRIWGKYDSCQLPSPSERARVLP